ncbi:MAG: hypothetical protein ACRD3A_08130 [Terriglobales bacterium]
MRKILCLAIVVCLAALGALAQDAAKVDAKHYRVVFEDAMVRVMRVHYGPHQKSPMHSHPNVTAVFLTDQQSKFTLPDGKTQMMSGKAGDAKVLAAFSHAAENMSDKAMDMILVEFKAPAKPAAAAPAKASTAPKK